MDTQTALTALRDGDKQTLASLDEHWSDGRIELFLLGHHEQAADLRTLVRPVSKLSPEDQRVFAGMYNEKELALAAAREGVTIDGEIARRALLQNNRDEGIEFWFGPFVKLLRMLSSEQLNDLVNSLDQDDVRHFDNKHQVVLFQLRREELSDESVRALLDLFDDGVVDALGPLTDSKNVPDQELKEEAREDVYIFSRIREGELTSSDLEWLNEKGNVVYGVYEFIKHLRTISKNKIGDEQVDELVRTAWGLSFVGSIATFTQLYDQGYRFADAADELGRRDLHEQTDSYDMMSAALLHDIDLSDRDHDAILNAMQGDYAKGIGLGCEYLRYLQRNDCPVADEILIQAARYTTLANLDEDLFANLLTQSEQCSQRTLQHCTLNLLAAAVPLGEKSDAQTEAVQRALTVLIDQGLDLPSAHPDSSFYASLLNTVNDLEESSPMDSYSIIRTARKALRLVWNETPNGLPDEEVEAVFEELIEGRRDELIEKLLNNGYKPTARQAGRMLDDDRLAGLAEQHLNRREQQSASLIEQASDRS